LHDDDDDIMKEVETKRTPKSIGAPHVWTLQDARKYADGQLHPNLRFLLFDSTGCDPMKLSSSLQRSPSLKQSLGCSLGLSRPSSARSSRPMSARSIGRRPSSARGQKTSRESLKAHMSRPGSTSRSFSSRPASARKLLQGDDFEIGGVPSPVITSEMASPTGRLHVVSLLAQEFLCYCPSGLPCIGSAQKIQPEEVNTENLARWAKETGYLFQEASGLHNGSIINQQCYMYQEPLFTIRDQMLRHYRSALGEMLSKRTKTSKLSGRINRELLEVLAVCMEAFEFELLKQREQMDSDAAAGIRTMLKLARAAASLRKRQAAAAAPGRAIIHERTHHILQALLGSVADLSFINVRGLGAQRGYDARILRAAEQDQNASKSSLFVENRNRKQASQNLIKIMDELLTLACHRNPDCPAMELLVDTELMRVLAQLDSAARKAEQRLIAHAY